jgi:S1-C subfamily serine protease
MAVLEQGHLDSVVAIEVRDGTDENGKPTYAPLGSGVLVGRPVPESELVEEVREGFEALYVYLVTNWHVIDGHDVVYAKMNAGGHAQRFALAFEDESGPLWFSYEDFDVAATFIKTSMLSEKDAEFVAVPEKQWLTVEQMGEQNVGLGNAVLVCGFPMGLSGNLRKFAIVRSGVIARLDPEIISEDRCFLLDCLIFPGNSGGPVFDYGSADHSAGPRLLGVVSGYLPYEDVAISRQTGKPRITFEENSGLASVVPVDAILGACAAYEAFDRGRGGEGGAPGANSGSSARLVPGPTEP